MAKLSLGLNQSWAYVDRLERASGIWPMGPAVVTSPGNCRDLPARVRSLRDRTQGTSTAAPSSLPERRSSRALFALSSG